MEGDAMKRLRIILLLSFAPVASYGQQLNPGEAATIEAAWASGARLVNTTVPLRRGFDINSPLENISIDSTGTAHTVTRFWERIEIRLPKIGLADHMACLMVNSKCKALPVGARLDKKNGILSWHVPNAYKGDFDLVFLQPGSGVASVRVTAGKGP
jgi:hypothetical protein